MKVEHTDRDGTRVFVPDGARIDAACVVDFKEALRAGLSSHDGRVLIDMARIEFLDSSGLGALVAVMKLLGDRPLELAGVGPTVGRVLSLTRMDQVFVLHRDVAAALDARTAA